MKLERRGHGFDHCADCEGIEDLKVMLGKSFIDCCANIGTDGLEIVKAIHLCALPIGQ